MKKNTKTEIVELNDGYFAEALDRVHCFQDSWERLIIDHPAIMQTPELKDAADKIQGLMFDLYQKCGAKIVN